MRSTGDRLVTSSRMDSLLAGINPAVPGSPWGLFGPGSISWRVNRESALFLCAGRAALLQLAHPWVAAAIEQHSQVLQDPIARFHNTFRVVFTMIFGSRHQAIASARGLYTLHTHIQGELPEGAGRWQPGEHYEANEIGALCWVYATLIESALLAYERVLPPLSAAERERYYQESKTLAALFGIPSQALPNDWKAFTGYCAAMANSEELGVTASARSMAADLLRGAGSWLHPPRWYRAATAMWLPGRLRTAFALELSESDRRSAQRALRILRAVYPRLPGCLRYVGPSREAQARLARKQPGLTVRWGNRFWIGQEQMPHGDQDGSPALPQ